MIRVYGYIRVSTASQAESEEVQREQIEKYVEEMKIRFGELESKILIERQPSGKSGVSGKTRMKDRPVGSVLLTSLQKGDHVVVLDLSRAFRSHRDAIICLDDWREQGVIFHSVRDRIDTSTVTGRLFFQFLSAFVEFERQVIAERTKEALASRRQRGKSMGGRPPIGRKVVGGKNHRRTIVCSKTAAAVKRIIELVDGEKLSIQTTAVRLWKEGFVNPRTGRIYSAMGVHRLYKARMEIMLQWAAQCGKTYEAIMSESSSDFMADSSSANQNADSHST